MTTHQKPSPLVSVIVPVYNVEQYLARCLDSLLNQTTDASYEVICINDCSPDESASILEDYRHRFPERIRMLENACNIGQGASRDYGVREARGTYLMFVDSDDYVRSDYIERYLAAMESNPCDVIIGGYIDTDGANETPHLLPHSPWTELCFSSGCAKLFRKSFILDNQLRFTDIRYAEDTLFNLHVFAQEPHCSIIDYAGYFYFVNPSSTTRKKGVDRQLEKILSSLYRSFVASPDYLSMPPEKKHMVEYSYIADMLNTILIYERGCGRTAMTEKHRFFKADLEQLFPEFRENPFFTLRGPKGQRRKIRTGVSLFRLLNSLHLDGALFACFA